MHLLSLHTVFISAMCRSILSIQMNTAPEIAVLM
mgnify:CR=1 FL=1